ncbi:MAG: o-succinylbenzoate synthase [Actinobacteria bacterium]|nr:o-succinylbenzoate synthase [Actinomycetota bacterium]
MAALVPRHFPVSGASISRRGRDDDAPPPVLSIRLHRVRLDGSAPFRSAREVIVHREVIIVEATDADGNVGWGECPAMPSPGYTAEYLEGCWGVLCEVLVPLVIAEPAEALERLARVPGNQMARHSLIGALVDLDLRARGVSLASALATAGGSAAAERVESTAVIGITDSLSQLEEAVGRAVETGHRSVKLKIDPRHDVEPVRATTRNWPDVTLAVDANGSYPDADTAVEALRRVESSASGLAYVEQPLGADDLVGSAIVARRVGSPVALDESVGSSGAAVTALSLGAMGALNVKPARVGGVLEAIVIADTVAAEGIPVFCGGMLESGIGRAAALAFAAQPCCSLPTDLGPSSRYHERDLTSPLELVDGHLAVPKGPGIGVVPDRAVLEASTTRSWSFP